MLTHGAETRSCANMYIKLSKRGFSLFIHFITGTMLPMVRIDQIRVQCQILIRGNVYANTNYFLYSEINEKRGW